jgi:hypothetical protein
VNSGGSRVRTKLVLRSRFLDGAWAVEVGACRER